MLPNSSTGASIQAVLVRRYGSMEAMMRRFNPDMQRVMCRDVEDCFFGEHPTLDQLNAGFGENTAFAWLIPQLYDLSEFCGCREKLQGKSLEQCADVMAMEFHHLKVTELMLFFYRFKSGAFGQFYGSVDPLVITTSVRRFLHERASAIAAHDRKAEELREKEWASRKMTWQEFCQRIYGEQRPMPAASAPKAPVQRKESDTDLLSRAQWIVDEKDAGTRATFSRLFMRNVGCSPEEYILRHGT